MKNINDLKVINRRKKKVYYNLILLFGLLTIAGGIHSLVTKFPPIFPLITIIIESIISKMYSKID
ncbi:MAG: hypothetical protein PHQ64_02190 [Bacilli bacterium]|nr:hypothetical protein [Bacilli bacterium]